MVTGPGPTVGEGAIGPMCGGMGTQGVVDGGPGNLPGERPGGMMGDGPGDRTEAGVATQTGDDAAEFLAVSAAAAAAAARAPALVNSFSTTSSLPTFLPPFLFATFSPRTYSTLHARFARSLARSFCILAAPSRPARMCSKSAASAGNTAPHRSLTNARNDTFSTRYMSVRSRKWARAARRGRISAPVPWSSAISRAVVSGTARLPRRLRPASSERGVRARWACMRAVV